MVTVVRPGFYFVCGGGFLCWRVRVSLLLGGREGGEKERGEDQGMVTGDFLGLRRSSDARQERNRLRTLDSTTLQIHYSLIIL